MKSNIANPYLKKRPTTSKAQSSETFSSKQSNTYSSKSQQLATQRRNPYLTKNGGGNTVSTRPQPLNSVQPPSLTDKTSSSTAKPAKDTAHGLKASSLPAKAPLGSRPYVAQNVTPAPSLRAKLKQDIANIKRKQLEKKLRLEAEKQRKILEKQQRKKEAEMKRLLDQSQPKQATGQVLPVTGVNVVANNTSAGFIVAPTTGVKATPNTTAFRAHSSQVALNTGQTSAPMSSVITPSMKETPTTVSLSKPIDTDDISKKLAENAAAKGPIGEASPAIAVSGDIPGAQGPVRLDVVGSHPYTPSATMTPQTVQTPLVPQAQLQQVPGALPTVHGNVFQYMQPMATVPHGQYSANHLQYLASNVGPTHFPYFQSAGPQHAPFYWTYGAMPIPLLAGSIPTNSGYPMYGRTPSGYPMGQGPSTGARSTWKPLQKTPRLPAKSLPTPEKPKLGASTIAMRPLESPSPFYATHRVLGTSIVLTKKKGESFGVVVSMLSKSALVDQGWVDNQYETKDSSKAKAQSSEDKSKTTTTVTGDSLFALENSKDPENRGPSELKLPIVEESKTRDFSSKGGRKEIDRESAANDPDQDQNLKEGKVDQDQKLYYFSALSISDPNVQNSRNPLSPPEALLQKGDLLLEINGTRTAGMTFEAAVSLIKSCDKEGEDGFIRCPLVVARSKIPLIPDKVRAEVPLSDRELHSLSRCILASTFDPKRVIGAPLSDETLRQYTSVDPALASRDLSTLRMLWSRVVLSTTASGLQKATSHWMKESEKEPKEVQALELPALTDSQRSMMRALPRPSKGCRCGSKDHEYVDSLQCPLFSNVRLLVDSQQPSVSAEAEAKKIRSKLPRDLNVVQKAYKERFIKERAEKSALEAEARFVAEMEDIQLSRQNKAIFAPSLTTIVLSAVADLEALTQSMPLPTGGKVNARIPKTDEKTDATILARKTDELDGVDSDDDDVPLAALAKKRPGTEVMAEAKRAKTTNAVHLKYLAKLLNYISSKWGHVFRESSDLDYSW